MKFNFLLFSQIIKRPEPEKRWPTLVYKTAFYMQFVTTFFAISSAINLIILYVSSSIIDYQFLVPILWYFAPLIFYFLILYIAPIAFLFIIGLILFKLFR